MPRLFFRAHAPALTLGCRRSPDPGRHLVGLVLPLALLVVTVPGWSLTSARGEAPATRPDEGPRLFRQYCQRCHGSDGRGSEGAAVDGLPDFTRRAWQDGRSDTELTVSILDGKGAGMPSFQGRLGEAQVRSLVARVRAFAPRPRGERGTGSSLPPAPGNHFAAQFRQLQEEYDRLDAQLKALRIVPPRSGSPVAPAPAQPGDSRDAAGQVRMASALFQQYCQRCHGADGKGNRQSPDGEGCPDFSRRSWQERRNDARLLTSILRGKSGEMPAFNRHLSEAEARALVAHVRRFARATVVASLPRQASGTPPRKGPLPPGAGSGTGSAVARHVPPGPPPVHRPLRWLGKCHVLLVHLPVTLFAVAAAGELWYLGRRARDPGGAVRFCVLFGAVGATSAVVFGWLQADFGGHSAGPPSLLTQHRWLGTLACLSALTAAVASEIDSRRRRRGPLFRILIFASALLIGATWHCGDILVHGNPFFDW